MMAARNLQRLYPWFRRHRASCFAIMTVGFVLCGALSLDLVRLFTLNGELLWMHGWQAVMDGGLMQLAELLVKALAANGSYLVFKCCEHALVHSLMASDAHDG
ncbi:hypothetical protein [Rhodoferax sp. GW822-FHT02A01]|uniref:hypothetical protein n=1 Tax=Rhodoferax sp. GW822-FHT02A01 TaxID=3141537 RepID=UPI00315C727D